MTLRWYTSVVDAHDIGSLSRWWADVLGWRVDYADADEVTILPPEALEGPLDDPATWHAQPVGLVFVPVPEGKTVKNRLHIDLAPHVTDDRDAEITALLAKGATRVDVGQDPDVVWDVLADPEGNEFCVLSSRDR